MLAPYALPLTGKMTTHDFRFARRLKELVAGLPQVEVARRLDYTQSRVSQMMRGERPSREFVERLIVAYELNREEWLALAGYGQAPDAEDERLAIARLAVDEYVRRAERPLSNRDRLAAWVLEMAEKYPHSRSLQVALRAGLEKLHEQPAEVLEHDLGVWETVLREEEENEEERG